VAAAFPKVASVVGAVCGVLGAVLTAADTEGEGAALVPTVLEQLGALQEQLPTAACVDAVVTALERYATLPAVGARREEAPLSAAVYRAAAPVVTALDADSSLIRTDPALVSHLFLLALRFCEMLPLVAVASRALPPLLVAATHTLEQETLDTEVTRDSLHFLAWLYEVAGRRVGAVAGATLRSLSHDDAAFVVAGVDALARPAAAVLGGQLLGLVVEGPNPDVADTLADTLLAVLAAYPDDVRGALEDSVSDLPAILMPSVAAGLSPAAIAAVVPKLMEAASAAVASTGPLPTTPFRQVLADFTAVCRGHASVDDMLAREFVVDAGFTTARAAAHR